MKLKASFLFPLLLSLSACISTKEYNALIDASDAFVLSVGGEYVAYVQSDSRLNPLSKQVRVMTVEAYQKAIEEARNRTK